MKLKYFKNQSEGEYELILHGIVGEEINGDDIAKEINFLNEIGAKVIKERINSIGGSVINGMSIVSANLQSTAEIHTFNEGMSASMASVILASGTPGKRKGFDFSMAVIHNPLSSGVSLDDIEDEKEKADIIKFKESLIDLYVNNTKMTRKQASDLMNKDSLIDSKQQIELGLIDEIVKSKMKPAITENMSLVDIMNVCAEIKPEKEDKNTLIINTTKMKDVTNRLKLQESASEAQVIQAIETIENRATKAEKEVTSLKADNQSKDEKITALNSEVDKYKNEAIISAVQSAIDSKKFDEDKKEELTNMASAMGVENFNKMVEMTKVPHVDVKNLLDNDKGGAEKVTGEKKLAKEYQNLAENNHSELERIKNFEPKRFEKMFNAWNNL